MTSITFVYTSGVKLCAVNRANSGMEIIGKVSTVCWALPVEEDMLSIHVATNDLSERSCELLRQHLAPYAFEIEVKSC